MRVIVTTFLITALTAVALSQDRKSVQKQTVKGTVVAQSVGNNFQSCWHVCSLHLIIRLEKTNPAEYAIIRVAYMDDRGSAERGSQWNLVELSRKWKFTASPTEPATVVLKEFATTYEVETGEDVSETIKMKEWFNVKGAEEEQLPFGQSLPNYYVEVGKFKAIN